MKLYTKMIVAVFLILTGSTLFAGGPELLYLPKDKVYMEIEIDGDMVGKWVSICGVYEYDSKGRLFRGNSGYSIDEYKYYGDGNKPIYIETTEGDYSYKDLYEYDKQGNMIYKKEHTGGYDECEYWYEYDKYGNVIYIKENGRGKRIYIYEYKYDSNNKITYGKKLCDGYNEGVEYHYELRFWYEYDKNGNKIHEWDSDGKESWYEYNENGNVIYSKFKTKAYDGSYEYSQNRYEYDENGNITLVRANETIYVHKLEYYEDGETLRKDTCYYYEKN